jgi:L,D-transpeptidase ErfK/SrfK
MMDSLEQGYSRLARKKQKKAIRLSKHIALVKYVLAIGIGIGALLCMLWFGLGYGNDSMPTANFSHTKGDFSQDNDGGSGVYKLLPNEESEDESAFNKKYKLSFDSLAILPLAMKEALPARRIIVNLPSRTLDYYNENKLVKTYPLAIGKPSTPTPLGSFVITEKEVNPWWYPPKSKKVVPSGPNNPLGYRWMGFAPMYGIHGTNTPWEIGSWVSNGCIRMRERDVEELFELVPYGMAVYIRYDLVRIEKNDVGQVSLGIYPDLYSLRKHAVTVSDVQRKLAEDGVPNFVKPDFLQQIIDKQASQQITLLQIHKLKVNGVALSGQVVAANGHLFIPIWKIAAFLHMNVEWDEEYQRVSINKQTVPGTVHNQILYVLAEDVQTVFGGMWLWEQAENSWDLAVLTIGGK